MISNAQKTLLHVAKAHLQLADEDYRALLEAEAGVSSSNDLDNRGLDRVLKRFAKLGFVNKAHRPRPRRQPAGLVTPAQQLLMQELYEQLGWSDPARQMGFARRVCKKSFPQTRGDAIKVIEGLKGMVKRTEQS
jgi:Protein of unknown function (DUF1018)